MFQFLNSLNQTFQIEICLSVTIHNHFYNILRLFDALPNFPFTTSQAMRDYYF